MNLDRRKASAEKRAVWLRNYQRARGRAMTRLAQRYPDEYQELLEIERAKDETEGKAWLDLSGRTKRSMDSAGAPSRDAAVSFRDTNADQQNEGNVGGEA